MNVAILVVLFMVFLALMGVVKVLCEIERHLGEIAKAEGQFRDHSAQADRAD